jgi:uncharacterized protein YjbJ (UPF0337 family)
MKGCQHMSGNTDKAAGMANEAAGKVKQGVGKAVGSEKLRDEGAGQEAKGDAQQLNGDAKNETYPVPGLSSFPFARRIDRPSLA